MAVDLATVKMNVPDWVQEVLSTFEKSANPHNEVQIADALRNASRTHEDMAVEDFKGYHAEWAGFLFQERPEEDSVWGTYFAAMATLQQNNETEYRPDIRNLDAEAVAHWNNRAHSTRDPVMRARYADLVWDLKRVITREKGPYDRAQVAIDSYLESTQSDLYTQSIEGVHWLRRALSLSLSIADKERTKYIVYVSLEFCGRVGTPQGVGIWIFPFDALYSKKGLLSPEQEAKVIGDLETMLMRTGGKDAKPEERDPHAAQAAAERLAQHYKSKNDRPNVERVIKTAGGAFERLAADASPMLAMAWLQPVIERYEQEGLKQDAERVQLLSAEKGKNISSDLKEISTQVEIKKSEIDEQVESLIGSGDLKTSLLKIAQTFIPRPKEARQFLEKMRKEAPLLSIFKIGIIEKDGHTAATVGSLDEDPEGRLHRQLGEFINFYQPFLRITLGRLRDRYKPSVDDILDFLCESPLFIPFKDGLLREALEAYEKEDFVKTIHVLVPQIEHILRDLLGLLGIPMLKTVRNNPGIMDAKGMNDILSDERMREALTESLWRYFTVLYIDKKGGYNLRNNLAHGLLPPNAFNREMADRVFHSLLALSLTRPTKRTSGKETTVPGNDQTGGVVAEPLAG